MPETMTLTQGDKAPAYAALPADPNGGALTILATPLVVLVDSTGAPVAGQSGTADGFDMGALAAPRVWWDLDTAALPAGLYTVVFAVQARGADGEARLLHPSVAVEVAGPRAVGAGYAAWPGPADVQAALDAAGVTLRLEGGAARRRTQAKLDEVITEVSRRTLRQFVTSAETRIFDGNGTPELEIDECVSVSAVAVIGIQADPGYSLSGFQLVSEQNKPRTRLVTARGSVPAYTSAGVYLPYHWVFPAGRQNISVTAVWGYAATIPADLWGAVADEAAYRLAAELCFRPTGRVLEQKSSDGSLTHFSLDTPAATQWHARYQKAVQDFKRPAGRRLRRMRGVMI